MSSPNSGRRRRWIRILLIACVALLLMTSLGIFGISAVAYRVMTSVNRCGQNGQPNRNVTPAEFQMPDYQLVSFPSRDGKVSLSAWYIPVKATSVSDAPVVIVVHGVSDCKHSPSVLIPAEMLSRAGFAVLMLDLRNHGDSGHDNDLQAMGTEEYLDVLGAWDWLTHIKGVLSNRIGLFGESLGAASVIDAGGVEPRIAAVWADSPFYSADTEINALIYQSGAPDLRVPALLAGRLLYGDNLTDSTLQPANMIARYKDRPLFITQGTADQTVPPIHLTWLAEAAAKAHVPVQTWSVPGSKHLSAMVDYAAEYERRLTTFFTQALANSSIILSG